MDSEHKKNLQNDMWRFYQLDKSTSVPEHPYHKFGTGDSKTLRDVPASKGIDVRKALLDFHSRHYSAGRMTLSIVGSQPVDTLAQWAEKYFLPIKDNGSKPPAFPGHPYVTTSSPAASSSTPTTGIIQYVVPVKDSRSLNIAWALPEQKTDWKAKSGRYLSHLLGHEGPGSVLAHLKARGWATEMFSGIDNSESGFSTFVATVELSADGLDHVDDVMAIVYAYIGVLRAHGPQKWVWEEEAIQAAASFRFQNKGHPSSWATQLSSSLAEYPREHVVSGKYLFWDFDAAGISKYLSYFTPSNARVRISSKSQSVVDKCDLKETWYQTPYGVHVMSPVEIDRYTQTQTAYEGITKQRMAASGGAAVTGGTIAGADGQQQQHATYPSVTGDISAYLASLPGLSPPLTLPSPNDFIASDFELRHPVLRAKQLAETNDAGVASEPSPSPTGQTIDGIRIRREVTPVVVRSDAGAEVWWHQDDIFAVPKLHVNATISLPACYTSPRFTVLLELWVRLVKESLNEFAYAAEVAGLRYDMHAVITGASMSFQGFSHKMKVLVAKASERLTACPFSDMTFAVQKDKLSRLYDNFSKEQPYQHAIAEGSLATSAPKWSVDEKRAVIASITPAELRAFLPELLRTAHVRMLVAGNCTRDEAVAVADALITPITAVSQPPTPSQVVVPRVLQLPSPMIIAAAGPDGTSSTTLGFELLYQQPARNPQDPNAGMDMLCQIGQSAVGQACSQTALIELASHVLSEPYFDTLRTQQQLGYIVFAGIKAEHGVEAVRFVVQSNKVPALELVDRTEAFLASFAATLEAMPADKFTANIRAVCIKRSEADKNLGQEAGRLWGEIGGGFLDFSRASNEVTALLALKQSDFITWFKECVAPGGCRRRVFISLVESGTEASAAGAEAADGELEEEEKVEEGVAAADAVDAESPQLAAAPAAPAAADDVQTPAAAAAGPEGGLAREDVLAPVPPGGTPAAAAPSPAKAVAATAAAPVPSITIGLEQAGLVLHHIISHGLGTSGKPVSVDQAKATFRAAGPAAEAAVSDLLSTSPASGRVRVVLPPCCHALTRALLPTYPDLGSARRAAWMQQNKASTTVATTAQ